MKNSEWLMNLLFILKAEFKCNYNVGNIEVKWMLGCF